MLSKVRLRRQKLSDQPMSKVRQVIETLFRIYNKDGELVDFIFNEIQVKIDHEVIEPIERYREEYGPNVELPPELLYVLRQSILKYRQGGVTTIFLAWALVECMYKYTVAVLLTHDKEHSEKSLVRAKLMLKNMKGPKPRTSKLNDNEIMFSKTNSMLYIGTAGGKEFGRSATINFLIADEIAFWKDPGHLMKSLFQAIPKNTGIILQLTTANGWGNWFQKSFYNYLSGIGGFQPHFYPWYIHDEYISFTPFIWDAISVEERKEEKKLYKRIKRARKDLTKHDIILRLQWRREKIDENAGEQSRANAIRDFNQEYPSTVQEAFVMTGGSLFARLMRNETDRWVYAGDGARKLANHPVEGFTYSLGADFAGGTGNDFSTINILCLETREQVYRFSDCYINPVDFAMLVCEVGELYNHAYLVPENNNHGLAGISIIKKNYPRTLIYKHSINTYETNAQRNIPTYGYGWRTSQLSKGYMVGIAQQFIYHGWRIYDPLTEDELKSMVEDPATGKIQGSGSHDDNAISFFLSCIGILRLLRKLGQALATSTDVEGQEIVVMDQVVGALAGSKAQVQASSKTLHTHRDKQGRYLVDFTHMFGKRKDGRKSAHV